MSLELIRPHQPNRTTRLAGAVLGLSALVSACGGGASSAGTLEVMRFARPTGALQCEASGLSATKRAQAQAAVEAAGVRVQAMACGHDGRVRITLCGTESGELLVADVLASPASSSNANSASEVSARMGNLGFQPWATWPEARTQACPAG